MTNDFDSTNPAVDVIIPVYNGARYLAEAVQSVLDQTYTRFAIIVVDDGSRDRTGAIADTFAASHPHVRVLHHRVNGNLGAALRTGFRHSRGDVVVTLDSDLTYDPAYVDRLLDDPRPTHPVAAPTATPEV